MSSEASGGCGSANGGRACGSCEATEHDRHLPEKEAESAGHAGVAKQRSMTVLTGKGSGKCRACGSCEATEHDRHLPEKGKDYKVIKT